MFQQLLGGALRVPDLGELVRQLGGAGGQGGQPPDIEALMRQLGGDRGLAGAGDAIQQMWKQMGIDPTDSGSWRCCRTR